MTIALIIVAVLVVAVVLWRVTRRAHKAPVRAIPSRRVERRQTSTDDGSTLLTGVVLGSVLFGGDSNAESPPDATDPPDASGDSGSIEGGSDGGFDTGGEF